MWTINICHVLSDRLGIYYLETLLKRKKSFDHGEYDYPLTSEENFQDLKLLKTIDLIFNISIVYILIFYSHDNTCLWSEWLNTG